MVNCFKGVFYKEYVSLLHNKKSFLFSILIFYLIFITNGIKNVQSINSNSQLGAAHSYAFYISIFISFVGMITTLKFWKEKAMHTLDSLLAIPFKFKVIFISKALFSTLVGTFLALIFYIISTLVFLLLYRVNIFTAMNLLEIVFFSFFLNFGYSIINGFSMWNMKEGGAKVVQLITYVVYIAGISSIIGVDMSSGITKNMYMVLLAATVLLNIIALFCLCIIDKEKVVLLQEF